MDKDEQLIDSLLKEHAKSKGMDEKFLAEVEEKINESESSGGNVIKLNETKQNDELASQTDWKKGLSVGVAACLAVSVAGTIIWSKNDNTQDVALDSGSAGKQIEVAVIEAEEVDRYVAKPKVVNEVERKPSSPSAVTAKVKSSVSPSPKHIPVPKQTIAEPSLDFASEDGFGIGWGGAGKDALGSRKKETRGDVTGNTVFGRLSNARNGETDHAIESKKLFPSKATNINESLNRTRSRQEKASANKFGDLIENSFTAPSDEESRRSTFAIDVDTASYASIRRMIQNGTSVPANAVRIEEMVNYFDYQYEQPKADGGHPFAVQVDSVSCPWNAKNKLVRVALQGKDIVRTERPATNLVFLLDVSGSMNATDKLPLLKQSLNYLLEEMDERDSVSMVVYAGASGLVLPATKADAEGRVKILKAMDNLSSGGSTAGGAGIKLAYKTAQENFIKDGVNRVVLATDGDFNVGISGTAELTKLVKEKAKKGVDISVLGFGSGNLNDEMLESITNNGNGNYSYIDTLKEGRKVLLEDMTGTLVTIAKDVKIQVEFNPEQVKEYRLIGYANRVLPNSAFLDKKADAGEIGAGHNVTAFYEIVPGKALDKSKLDEFRYAKKSKKDEIAEVASDLVDTQHSDELLFVKLAYKQPHEKINDDSTYLTVPLKVDDKLWEQADADFKFASSVALFGMVLRDSDYLGNGNLELVQQLAESGKGPDGKGYREEFIKIVKKMKDRE